ncbi:MAG: peptide-methionine (S)-S-oxide reductase MsrA [Spirochaetes bacterium]|nr:peptide-methionine (S)-S-oxide reductase MsrA [Spirochaetota bacterium]
MDITLRTAVFGGGCFWCMEAVYELVPGVVDVENGFAGGSRKEPSYEQVSTGLTGHAEVVKLTFDPAKVSYAELLDLFWKMHDPTQVDRQGADTGDRYRSIILYTDENQRLEAERSMAAISKELTAPLATELSPLVAYWPAEDCHQDYFRKHPDRAYCRIVIAPKVDKYLGEVK